MSYLEELLPEFRKGAKIRQPNWDNGEYIYLGENGIVYDERNKPFDFTNEELFSEWKLYQEPIDWNYIIKKQCLCWFWDGSGDDKDLGILINVNENKTLCRYDCIKSNGDFYQYANCRPVLRDEVTFYEDRKDEI